MSSSRIMDKIEDFETLGINPLKIEAWEDGRRDTNAANHGEIWYFDCSFDDGSTLVLGFRTKSVDQVSKVGDNPNVAINYNNKDKNTFYDYRLCSEKDAEMSKDCCNVKFGPNSLVGHNWRSYDIQIEAEEDKEVIMEGKKSVKHETTMNLHFEALVEPFRPGTGYISFGSNDEFYYNFICITKLKVTGEVSINGENKNVSGSAYYNHQWWNVNSFNAFHHWVWGRQNIGEYNVLIYDMVSAEKYGFTQIPLFTIDDNEGNRIFENISTDNMKVKLLDSYVQKETGKTYPKILQYNFSDGKKEIEYVISSKKEIHVLDFYSKAPENVKKTYDDAHMQPTYTRYLAETELKITENNETTVIAGSMLYEVSYAGLPNSNAHFI